MADGMVLHGLTETEREIIAVSRTIIESIEQGKEAPLRTAIIRAMELFLEGHIDKDCLEGMALNYLHIPIRLKWKRHKYSFPFQDPKLRYVFGKLSAFCVEEDDVARTKARRFIRFLNGEDYENLPEDS
jgi:hypothetical protein